VSRFPTRVAMLSVHTCPLAALGGKKTGGMNVYVRELSKELGRRGVLVDVFTRSQDPCVPHVNDRELAPGVRVIHVPTGPEQPLSTKDIYPHLPEFVDGVRAFAAEEEIGYNLIHSHYWLSGSAALDLRDSWRVPVIQMFHTLGQMKNRIAQSDRERESEVRLAVEKQVIDQADILVAATPAERIQLMWLYGADMGRIKVIPPGVDVEHFQPLLREEAQSAIGMPDDHRMLLFVGRIEPLKGLETLMRAIGILKRSMPELSTNLCVVIVGGSKDTNEHRQDAEISRLKQLGDELGLNDLVTFIGSRNQESLPYYYSAAEAVIMPSHYESFGMVALEAMACGTPVIASEVGGLAYLVQDGVTGFHVPDREPDELAGKMCLLLSNPALRREMSAAATQHAQQYAWPVIADRIQALYRNCLN
jgi:D-inositol-3-phosphate glycosyltransferase